MITTVMRNSLKIIMVVTSFWSCMPDVKPLPEKLINRFPHGDLPFQVTRESFYEYGEWSWHDSVVEKRVFPELSRDEMAMLRDTVANIPAGLTGRFVALRRFGPVKGCSILLYRRDIGPIDEELGPDTLDHQFVMVSLDKQGGYADRKILGRWQSEIGMLKGKLGKDLQVQTTWVSLEPKSDSVTVGYSIGDNCRWRNQGQ